MQRKIFGYVLKGTEKQLDEMYDLLNFERFHDKKMNKYFNIWIGNYGIMCFPKERYFVSKNGEYDYHKALNKYSGGVITNMVFRIREINTTDEMIDSLIAYIEMYLNNDDELTEKYYDKFMGIKNNQVALEVYASRLMDFIKENPNWDDFNLNYEMDRILTKE